jgi:hypothetical protein
MTWENIRAQRNQLLKDSDWTQIANVPDNVDVLSWSIYRQTLRDLTAVFANPEDVVFPAEPGNV